MKIGMYMYDREIDLNEESTKDFIAQYKNAKDTMKQLLTIFEDEETRTAIFYMMGLRTLIDDFIEFCTDVIDVDLMEKLLNNEEVYEDEPESEEDDFEILVDFDEEEQSLKDSTKKLINEQLKTVVKELDDILDPKERTEQRMKLIELLANVSEKIN